MMIAFGTEVVDKTGKPLGTVGYVIRNSWTGEISKFTVHRDMSDMDLSFSPEEVLEEKDSQIKINIFSDDLNMSN